MNIRKEGTHWQKQIQLNWFCLKKKSNEFFDTFSCTIQLVAGICSQSDEASEIETTPVQRRANPDNGARIGFCNWLLRSARDCVANSKVLPFIDEALLRLLLSISLRRIYYEMR